MAEWNDTSVLYNNGQAIMCRVLSTNTYNTLLFLSPNDDDWQLRQNCVILRRLTDDDVLIRVPVHPKYRQAQLIAK